MCLGLEFRCLLGPIIMQSIRFLRIPDNRNRLSLRTTSLSERELRSVSGELGTT